MADGFKIAEAYVDINAKMDSRQIKRTIEAGLKEAGLRESGNAAGEEISNGIKEAVEKNTKDTGKKVSDNFENSGRDSRNGFMKHFAGLASLVGDVATTSMKIFGDIFNFNSPMLTLIVLTAAISALPIAASAAAVGIVGAFGGAFAAIGILAVKDNEEVRRVFAEAWGQVKAIAQTVSEPFINVMKVIAGEWVKMTTSFAPHLQTMFTLMAPHLEGFVRNFSLAFQQLIPAMGPLTQAFNVILDRLGPALITFFGQLAETVSQLSQKLVENPGAVDAVIGVFTYLVDVLGDVIGAFVDVTGWIQRNADAVGGLFQALWAILSPAALVTSQLGGLGQTGSEMDKAMQGVRTAVANVQGAMATASTSAETYAQSLDEVAKQNLSAEQASLRFDQSVLKMKQSIDDNGKSLDSHTVEGAKNKDALLSMAEAANRAKDKFIEQGQSADEVRSKSVTMREEMIRQATQLGMNRDQAAKLIDKYFAIPPKVSTTVEAPGADHAKTQADNVKNAANAIPRDVRTNVNVQDNASNALNDIINIIGRVARQIWVNVTSIFSEDGNIMSFAGGSENHVAQIAGAGAMRVWAEPETGGEAYIPLAPNKRHRSEAILTDVASRFGLTVGRQMADGGVLDSVMAASGSRGGSVSIDSLNVSVNLAGVWDFTDPTKAREIANKIAPAIREAIRVDERRFA